MLRRMIMLSAVLLVVFASAAHAQYVPGQPGFILDPDTVPAGGAESAVIGSGCPPSTAVTVTIDGQVVGTGTSVADKDGGFNIPIAVPPELTPGEYTVVVTCGSVRMTNILTVIGGTEVTTTTGTLPRTGSDSLPYVRVGIALVAAGGLLVLGARKRRVSV